MANVVIVGAGHVGVVYAAGLAELGHKIRVLDIDPKRLARLRRGDVWFFEPGLTDLLRRGLRRKRITVHTSYDKALNGAEFVFICVPTPSTSDGNLDDSMLRSAYEAIREHVGEPPPIIVNKSTVPVGTGDLAERMFGDPRLRVVSNPEFLAQGRAVEDFFHPSRILLGARDRRSARAVARLFAPRRAPVVYTDPTTAELTKLAAAAFLAMKVSYSNAISRLAEAVGADADAMTRALGLDPRIGPGHLQAGLGYGGSCLPKDLAAVEHLAARHGSSVDLFAAVRRVNAGQRTRAIDFMVARFGSLNDRRIAVLGLAFKAGTDDTRESSAVFLAKELLDRHAAVVCYDPLVRADITTATSRAERARSALLAARNADAVVFATDWPEFKEIDLSALRGAMSGNLLIDGRAMVDPALARAAGFDYFGFGRGGDAGGVEQPT